MFRIFVVLGLVATELLGKYCPDVLLKPKPTPVVDILEQLKETTALEFKMMELGVKGTAKKPVRRFRGFLDEPGGHRYLLEPWRGTDEHSS